jgi:hypothetical protein
LVAASIAVNLAVFAASGSDMVFVLADLSRVFTIGAAMIIALIVVFRQGVSGIFGRAYVALAIGIVLWFAAESTWTYYELILGVESPFPSLADGFWLAAYAFIGYHLFTMAKFYGKGVKKYIIAVVGAGIAIFAGLYISQLVAVTELVDDAMLGLAISVAYPLLDAVLFLPAIVIVLNSGRGYLTSIPWIFIGWIILGIGDTLLGITAVQNFEGDVVLINTFYTIAYMSFAVGLYWYKRFFVFDPKKIGVQ